ncbi:hypothetical protein BGW80DRAFT_1328657 [Lactifluus volemus]|nr:hypothetical protein BGW80DRAFT_1328657 [Lactifluus volemus]
MLSHYEFEQPSNKDNSGSPATSRATSVTLHNEIAPGTDTTLLDDSESANRRYIQLSNLNPAHHTAFDSYVFRPSSLNLSPAHHPSSTLLTFASTHHTVFDSFDLRPSSPHFAHTPSLRLPDALVIPPEYDPSTHASQGDGLGPRLHIDPATPVGQGNETTQTAGFTISQGLYPGGQPHARDLLLMFSIYCRINTSINSIVVELGPSFVRPLANSAPSQSVSEFRFGAGTADASKKPRINDRKFQCPVPGCGGRHMCSHNDEIPMEVER